MIDRLHALVTPTVIPLILCGVANIYLPSMLSNTARKQRQSTADCTHGRWAQLRRLATWLHSATRACMWRAWMPSNRRCRFVRTDCSAMVPTQFMNAAFQPTISPWLMGESQSCSGRDQPVTLVDLGRTNVPKTANFEAAPAKSCSARFPQRQALAHVSHHDSAVDA